MKSIQIVQEFNRRFPESGWHPVYSCDSRQEAVQWMTDKSIENQRKGLFDMSYRIESCPFWNR